MRIMDKYGKILFALLLCLTFVGCQIDNAKLSAGESIADIEYKQLPVVENLQLGESEEENLCYQDENTLIFSIGPRNGASEGPLNATMRIVEYDLKEQKIKRQYREDSFWTVCSAVPAYDGIAYVYYEAQKEGFGWEIRYQDIEGVRVLDAGTCDSYDDSPKIFLIEETLVFLYEDHESGTDGKIVGLKKIVDGAVECIAEYRQYSLRWSILAHNGSQYIFEVQDHENHSFLLVGDLEDINVEEPIIDGSLNSFGINGNEAFYSICEGKWKSSFYSVDLKTRQTNKLTEEARPYYRLSGSGESIVCVDSGFNLYTVDSESGELQSAKIPENYEDLAVPAAITFYPLLENRYIVLFNNDYWIMNVIGRY